MRTPMLRPVRFSPLPALLMGALALSAVGCSHARTVGPRTTSQEKREATQATGGSGTAGMERTSHAGKARGNHPPIASSPDALLKPGAEEKIEDALRSHGFLHRSTGNVSSTQLSAAVRRFQEHEGLAATGYPDNKTLDKLGVKPEEVNRTLDARGGTTAKQKRAAQ